jgi:hypothetical protein
MRCEEGVATTDIFFFPKRNAEVSFRVPVHFPESEAGVVVSLRDGESTRVLTENLPWREALETAFRLVGCSIVWENPNSLEIGRPVGDK